MAAVTVESQLLSRDVGEAVRMLKEMRIRHVDLKEDAFGSAIEEMTPEQNDQLSELVEKSGMEVHCLSSRLGDWHVDEMSEREFRDRMQEGIENLLDTADGCGPAMISLVACRFKARPQFRDANEFLFGKTRWVYSAYRRAIEAISAEGYLATIENAPESIFSNPAETVSFFQRLDCGEEVGLTWDIQGMWRSGIWPSLESYAMLRPVVNYVRLKGGRANSANPKSMSTRSLLRDASWPVRPIVMQVLADGVSPVLCLSECEAEPADDYALKALWGKPELRVEEARQNLQFMRETFPELRNGEGG